MNLARRAARSAAAVALVWHSGAHAEEASFPRVALETPACPIEGVADADLRIAAALELSAQGIELLPVTETAALDGALVSIRYSCIPGDDIALEASWAAQQRVRRLNVSSLPLRTRTRALALALAELLGSFRKAVRPEELVLDESDPSKPTADLAPAPHGEPEPATRAPPAMATAAEPAPPPPAKPEPRPSDRAPSQPASRTIEVGVSPEVRLFVDGETVAGMRPHVDHGVFGVGLSVLGTSTTLAAGRISALVLHGTLALRFLQSPNTKTVSVTAGPRLGAGIVRVSGHGVEGVSGADAIDPYLDGGAYAMLELRPERSLRLGLGFEIGHSVGVVALADADPVATYGGPFVGALLDLSLAL